MSDSSCTSVIPAGWVLSPIGDLLAPFENANPNKSGRETFWYVDIEAIDNREHRITSPKSLPADRAPSRARKVIRRGDVLISLVRPYLKNIAIVPADLNEQWASTAFCVCRPRDGIDSRFLYYLYLQNEFLNAIPTYGDSPPSGHDDDLLATVIALPPELEQSRIADRIDELFTDLAGGVAALERVKRNLSRYRAAVLHAAVTGRLTEAWRKEHGPPEEPAPKLLERILVERRKQWERRTLAAYEAKGKQPPKNWKSRYKEPAPPKLPEDETTLPDLPPGWCWGTALQLCTSVDNGNTPPADKMFPDTGEVPFIKVYNLTKRGILDFSVKPTFVSRNTHAGQLARSVVYPGDVLMNIVGPPLGKVSLVPDDHPEWNINQAVVVFHCMDGIRNDYLVSCLLSDTVLSPVTEKAKASAGQFNISVTMCRELLLPLPPATEQAAIVEAVNEKLSQIDALEAEVTRGLARAGRLRQAILKAAFEGKLVPQDASDEPARILLERIREQAADAAKPKRKTRKKTTRRAATR